MGFGRSTFYDIPDVHARNLTIVAEMKTICDEFEAYGYRRVDAELRHRGIVVNTKKIRRLMREHTLNPKQHSRFIATTDSDHDYPIFPDLAKTMTPDGPQPALGGRHHLCRNRDWLCVLGCDPRCLVPSGRRLCYQPLDRCAARCCCAQGRHQRPRSTKGMRASFRPWITICLRRLSHSLARARSQRLPWVGVAIPTTTPRPRAS